MSYLINLFIFIYNYLLFISIRLFIYLFVGFHLLYLPFLCCNVLLFRAVFLVL
jgi:hypothetical protein